MAKKKKSEVTVDEFERYTDKIDTANVLAAMRFSMWREFNSVEEFGDCAQVVCTVGEFESFRDGVKLGLDAPENLRVHHYVKGGETGKELKKKTEIFDAVDLAAEEWCKEKLFKPTRGEYEAFKEGFIYGLTNF